MDAPEPQPEFLLGRRAALKAGILAAEGLAVTLALPIEHTISMIRHQISTPFRLNDGGYGPDARNRLTDAKHPSLENTGSIRNLGVWHAEPFFHMHRQHFHEAIDACDLLLTEGNIYENTGYANPSGQRFFELCNEYAGARNKTIYFIDRHRTPLLHYQGAYSLPLVSLTGLVMTMDTSKRILSFMVKEKEQHFQLLTTRRNVLRAIAGLGLVSAWMPGSVPLDITTPPEEYDGYIVRGRSAIMMHNVLTVAEAAPAAKILTITGDAHAELFEHYFGDPDLLAQDLRTYSIHDTIYSLPITKKGPGDLEPREV